MQKRQNKLPLDNEFTMGLQYHYVKTDLRNMPQTGSDNDYLAYTRTVANKSWWKVPGMRPMRG